MKNGLYQAKFSTPLGSGSGVVVANDGQFLGGDATIYYSGSYSEDDGTIKASLSTGRHDASGQSVFGSDNVSIQLSGSTTETSAQMAGSHSGVNFQVSLKLICD